MTEFQRQPKVQPQVVDGQLKCPQCGNGLAAKEGKYGPYFDCSAGCGYRISKGQVKVYGSAPVAPSTPATSTTTTSKTFTKAVPTLEGLRAKFDEIRAEFAAELECGLLSGEDIRAMAIHLNIGR